MQILEFFKILEKIDFFQQNKQIDIPFLGNDIFSSILSIAVFFNVLFPLARNWIYNET